MFQRSSYEKENQDFKKQKERVERIAQAAKGQEMTFTDKLLEEKIDVKDQEKVLMLQRFWVEGFNAGMTAKNPNVTHYENVFEKALPRLEKLFKMISNPTQLQKLLDGLDAMDDFWSNRSIY